jgi:hypothetical protein
MVRGRKSVSRPIRSVIFSRARLWAEIGTIPLSVIRQSRWYAWLPAVYTERLLRRAGAALAAETWRDIAHAAERILGKGRA